MNIDLTGLPVGDWRDLTESEMKVLYSMLEDSSGVAEKKPKSKQPAKKGKPSNLKTPGSKKPIQGHSPKFNRGTKAKPSRRLGRG